VSPRAAKLQVRLLRAGQERPRATTVERFALARGGVELRPGANELVLANCKDLAPPPASQAGRRLSEADLCGHEAENADALSVHSADGDAAAPMQPPAAADENAFGGAGDGDAAPRHTSRKLAFRHALRGVEGAIGRARLRYAHHKYMGAVCDWRLFSLASTLSFHEPAATIEAHPPAPPFQMLVGQLHHLPLTIASRRDCLRAPRLRVVGGAAEELVVREGARMLAVLTRDEEFYLAMDAAVPEEDVYAEAELVVEGGESARARTCARPGGIRAYSLCPRRLDRAA
jgi:hypothetical protein